MGAISTTILDESIRTTQELLERLERDRSDIDKRLTELREQLATFRAAKECDPPAPRTAPAKGRRRKGENRRAIDAIYDANPAAGLTKQEIAEKTKLPFSSVQAVLDRDGSGYFDEGGLWKRRKTVGQ